jgi:hypothetical protein
MAKSKLPEQATGLLVGYALQFLVGMLLNLFVTLPAKHPGTAGHNYFGQSVHSLTWALSNGGGWELTAHVYLGLLLVLGSCSLFVRALFEHDRQWAIAGGVAALFTLGAAFNGLSFIDFNKDISSMIMATCWLVAVGALIVALLKGSTKK